MPQPKEWTLMFYLASDNPLAPGIIPQLKSIKQAGFHQDVNVIAQFDPQPEGTPTHIFDVNLINKLAAGGKSQIGYIGDSVADPFVSNLIEDKLWRHQRDRTNKSQIRENLKASFKLSKHPILYDPPVPPPDTKRVPRAGEEAAGALALARSHNGNKPGRKARQVELGPAESLKAFLKFCANAYPARHYALFILGHGVIVGNDVFLFDENADEQSLSLKGLGNVLHWFKSHLNRKVPGAEFELVSFHSCSVSSIEVAYELQGTANYMLASQGPAFVGSWPYRQILIRLFKDAADLKELEDNEARAARLTEKGELALRGQEVPERERARREYWRRKVRNKIAKAFCNITDYCFHNNKDFLMAGYSFGVTLCDLRDVSGHFTGEVAGLRKALVAALSAPDGDASPHIANGVLLARNCILLAHLEAQSNWQESYTDLYDFCFCLSRQCSKFIAMLDGHAAKALCKRLAKLKKACEAVTRRFPDEAPGRKTGKKRCESSNDVIVKNEYMGPEQQYAHGLSVYFPWSAPSKDKLILADYEEYTFNVETGWLKFLKTYFTETQRRSRPSEDNDMLKEILENGNDLSRAEAQARLEPPSAEEMLSEDIASFVFNGGGQFSSENTLSNGGGKVTPKDPTGDECGCASIKNYPRDTRDLRARKQIAFTPTNTGDVVPFSKGCALLPRGAGEA